MALSLPHPPALDLLHRISKAKDFSEANLVHQMAPLEEQLKSFEVFVGILEFGIWILS